MMDGRKDEPDRRTDRGRSKEGRIMEGTKKGKKEMKKGRKHGKQEGRGDVGRKEGWMDGWKKKEGS